MPNTLTTTVAPPNYRSLPLALFEAGVAPQVDTYAVVGESSEPRLLASAEIGISDSQFDALHNGGVHDVLITEADFAALHDELEAALPAMLENEQLAPGSRLATLQAIAEAGFDSAFKRSDCGAVVEAASEVGAHIAHLVTSSSPTAEDLFTLASHDLTTFAHATNVSVYAVLLAQGLGVRHQATLDEIAVGGMLHDLGKRRLPRRLLCKRDRLTTEERRLIETHPQAGYEELHGRMDVTFSQRMMCYQHHEWVNGEGYPVAILGDEIHEWAKLLAVVDVFDALTAIRPYRKQVTPADACLYIAQRALTQFDVEAVKCWIDMFDQ